MNPTHNTTTGPDFQPTPPVEGDTAKFLFTATGGESVTVKAEYITGWQDATEPCIESREVAAILNAWSETDEHYRKVDWPSTERTDDDAFIAFLATDGQVVLDRWPVANERDSFSLDVLPRLLPDDQYTLTRLTPPKAKPETPDSRP